MSEDLTIVRLTEKRLFGFLLSWGAYVSLIKYSDGVHNYEEYVENDEWEEWEPDEYEQE